MTLEKLLQLDEQAVVLREGEFDSLCNLTTKTEVRCLSFAGNDTYIKNACKLPHITCLIIPPECADIPELQESGKGILLAKNPKTLFHMFHKQMSEKKDPDYVAGREETIIGENCQVHPSASIASQGVVIGNNVIIEEHVIIREGVTIGDNAYIMAGSIIGYSACLAGRDFNGNLLPLHSAGTVRIGDYVQIGAYSFVSKGFFPYECSTIGDYSIVGCAVDLSHNDTIGKNVIILDQSQVCGNTIVEDDVHLSPQIILSNRLKVEEKADVAIGSVVVTNVKKGTRVAGNYAIDNDKFLLWHRKKLRSKNS